MKQSVMSSASLGSNNQSSCAIPKEILGELATLQHRVDAFTDRVSELETALAFVMISEFPSTIGNLPIQGPADSPFGQELHSANHMLLQGIERIDSLLARLAI